MLRKGLDVNALVYNYDLHIRYEAGCTWYTLGISASFSLSTSYNSICKRHILQMLFLAIAMLLYYA